MYIKKKKIIMLLWPMSELGHNVEHETLNNQIQMLVG